MSINSGYLLIYQLNHVICTLLQVMYMYYLLGHRLVGQNLDARRKQALADNTFILTLDGDVDFKPSAVQVLVDRMKRNEKVGAACGRIHPIGMGELIFLHTTSPHNTRSQKFFCGWVFT